MSGGESGRLISSELLFQRVRRYGSVVCMGTYREETPGAGTKGARMNRRAHGTNEDIKSLLPPGTGCYRYLPWSRATQPENVNLPFGPSSSVPPSLFFLLVHTCTTACSTRVHKFHHVFCMRGHIHLLWRVRERETRAWSLSSSHSYRSVASRDPYS